MRRDVVGGCVNERPSWIVQRAADDRGLAEVEVHPEVQLNRGRLPFGTYLAYGTTGLLFFFFQAEDGIRDTSVTGVQTCALPISPAHVPHPAEYPPPAWCTTEGKSAAGTAWIR